MDGELGFLRSGTDIRAVASGSGITLDSETVRKIALAFSVWLKERGVPCSSQTIAVGHDSRLTGFKFKSIFINTLMLTGAKILDCSLASTPAMAMSYSFFSCGAAVEITASHLPKKFNGFKFFFEGRGVTSEDIGKILSIAERGGRCVLSGEGNARKTDLTGRYSQYLRDVIKSALDGEMPLKDFKVAINCSNGAGGFFVNDVLKPLGCDIGGSILTEPNGNFPIHEPNPENEYALGFALDAANKANADLGVIFDSDVDRAAFFAEGEIICKSRLAALCSAIALKNEPGTVIVVDSTASEHLKEFIMKLGGLQFRHKRGYHNVISAAREINSSGARCSLAIETSGHAAFAEHGFIDDGAYLAARVIIEAVKLKKKDKSILSLINKFKIPAEQKEIRFTLKKEKQPVFEVNEIYNKIKKICEDVPCAIERDNVEGVRLNFHEEYGWAIIRKSIHTDEMVINVESDISGGAKKILKYFEKYLHYFEK